MNVLALFIAASALFADPAPLEVTLQGPVQALSGKPAERAFALRHEDRSLAVTLAPRGKSRRRFCDFAPLRLDLVKRETEGTVFAGQNKLKMVTHCNSKRASEINVLEEYLAYRILNVLTDASLRARLLRVRYARDTGKTAFTKWAFVIEDIDHLAARMGGAHVEPEKIARQQLNEAHGAIVNLFQYLISNTDYSLLAAPGGGPCCHNAKLIEHADGHFAIPYDFDLSGLVNPSYPSIDTVNSRRSLRYRNYRGFCVDDAVLDAALARFREKAPEIAELIATVPGLDGRPRRIAQKFVDAFYREIERSGAAAFAGRCR